MADAAPLRGLSWRSVAGCRFGGAPLAECGFDSRSGLFSPSAAAAVVAEWEEVRYEHCGQLQAKIEESPAS